jgi:glycosyltransferase involved in cell wall biosynthesis
MISIIIISKDEPELATTLTDVTGQAESSAEECEILVVDASQGRLNYIALDHPSVCWRTFERPPTVKVSIPHQRNAGVQAAKGEVIVFTDAGCRPTGGWLNRLVAPILEHGEDVVAGPAIGPEGSDGIYDAQERSADGYLDECPTINLAFRRQVYDQVGGFDEQFEYGSDVDFSWRLTDAGFRIRSAPDALVTHHWGDRRRQVRRSYAYGKARARLYRKHRARRRQLLRRDPMVVVYPMFLLGLPVTLIFPPYPLLLLVPAWRNRHNGAVRVVADHLVYGVGILAELLAR